MSNKRDIHVVPHANGWAAKRENASRASTVHSTQHGALERARAIAEREHVEVVIHNRLGQIRDSDSYGKDPCPPKDRKR